MENFAESYDVLIIWQPTTEAQKYCVLIVDDYWKPLQGRCETQHTFLN